MFFWCFQIWGLWLLTSELSACFMWDENLSFFSCLPFLAGEENHLHRKSRVSFSSPPIRSSAWGQGVGWRGQEGSSWEDCSGRHSRWQYCAFVVQGHPMGAFDLLKGNVLSFFWMENVDRRERFTGLEGSLVGGQTPVKCTPWHHCPHPGTVLKISAVIWDCRERLFETDWESKWGRGSVSAKTVF